MYVFKQINDGKGGFGYRKMTELSPSGGLGPDSSFGISLDGKGSDVIVGDYGKQRSYLFSFDDGIWKERAAFDDFNTALSGNSIMQHSPDTFEMNNSNSGQYGGDANFYDLNCEQ